MAFKFANVSIVWLLLFNEQIKRFFVFWFLFFVFLLFTITLVIVSSLVKGIFFGSKSWVYDNGESSIVTVHLFWDFLCACGIYKWNEYTVKNPENLDELIDHIERMYVCRRHGTDKTRSGTPRFPEETWSLYKSLLNGDHRMNKASGGWHSFRCFR